MSQAFGGGGGYGRFSPINQGPAGMPVGPPNDPPGYYLGWPLANLAKRVVAGVLDWGVFWFAALMVAGLGANAVSAVVGQSAGEFAGFVLLIGAYGALFYNFAILQNRTGQSWGKRMLGLRTVSMIELRPPGKPTLALKPLFEVFEVLTGIAFVAIAFGRYRQTLCERFCSVVVLDERKAGATLPWVLPGDPVLDPGPPVPQGGVPRPERPRRREDLDPGPTPWARSPSSGPGRGQGDDHSDLPEREFGDEPPPRPRPRASSGDLPPLGHVEREGGIGKLNIPPGFVERHQRETRSALPPAALPGPEPSPSPSAPAGTRYLTDPLIAEALRARDTTTAHRRAKACIDAAFDHGEAIDVEQAVAEYRRLIASAGLAVRASDDTVAGWLGLI